jgi:predicted nucleotidyltransferase
LAVKPSRGGDYREVVYGSERWALLKRLREKAAVLMSALDSFHLPSVVHGSIARGDVKAGSDIDVFIANVQNSFIVETALEKAGIHINNRLVVQATPTYAMKAHIEIDEEATVSFPLMDMRKVEREFYRFGGEINLAQLRDDVRVLGVDKRLMLIEPTLAGHTESSVVDREEAAARALGVSVETVLDRVHALQKRDNVGRTGVFVKRELPPHETFELALKRISDANAAVRRRMKK